MPITNDHNALKKLTLFKIVYLRSQYIIKSPALTAITNIQTINISVPKKYLEKNNIFKLQFKSNSTNQINRVIY